MAEMLVIIAHEFVAPGVKMNMVLVLANSKKSMRQQNIGLL